MPLALPAMERARTNLSSTIRPQLRIHLQERFDGIVQCQQIRVTTPWQCNPFIEEQMSFSAPLRGRLVSAGITDQGASCHLRRDGLEMMAIMPLNTLLINKLEIDLMDKACALQGMISSFQAKLPRGKTVQLVIHLGNKLIQGISISPAPAEQRRCDVFARAGVDDHLSRALYTGSNGPITPGTLTKPARAELWLA